MKWKTYLGFGQDILEALVEMRNYVFNVNVNKDKN